MVWLYKVDGKCNPKIHSQIQKNYKNKLFITKLMQLTMSVQWLFARMQPGCKWLGRHGNDTICKTDAYAFFHLVNVYPSAVGLLRVKRARWYGQRFFCLFFSSGKWEKILTFKSLLIKKNLLNERMTKWLKKSQ